MTAPGTGRLRKVAEIFDKGAKRARDSAATRTTIDDEQTDIEVATYHAEAAAACRAVIAVRDLPERWRAVAKRHHAEAERHPAGSAMYESARGLATARENCANTLAAILGALGDGAADE